MRPPISSTSRPARRRAQSATLAAAVGLAIMLGGGAEAQAGVNAGGNAGGRAGISPVASTAATRAATIQSGRMAGAGLGAATQPAAATGVVARKRRFGRVHLDINLSRQRAVYYRGGQRVATFRVSSGKRGWRTPTGSYRVQRKLHAWRRSRLGLMWKPAYFRGGYAIHGSRSVPGYPASHGCVRVTMSRMNWLAPRLPIGATVRVHY